MISHLCITGPLIKLKTRKRLSINRNDSYYELKRERTIVVKAPQPSIIKSDSSLLKLYFDHFYIDTVYQDRIEEYSEASSILVKKEKTWKSQDMEIGDGESNEPCHE